MAERAARRSAACGILERCPWPSIRRRSGSSPMNGPRMRAPPSGSQRSKLPAHLSLLFNACCLCRHDLLVRPACRGDMRQPPLDDLRVPLTELEDTKAAAVAFIMSWHDDGDGADRGMGVLAGFRSGL